MVRCRSRHVAVFSGLVGGLGEGLASNEEPSCWWGLEREGASMRATSVQDGSKHG